jgi:hypothetical protein
VYRERKREREKERKTEREKKISKNNELPPKKNALAPG